MRMRSEAWLLAVTAVAILGDRPSDPPLRQSSLNRAQFGACVAVALAMVCSLIAFRLPSSEATILRKVEDRFPVHACEFIAGNNLPGPILNDLAFGGFLSWRLPAYPVSIDDRIALYGEDATKQYVQVAMGKVPLDSDPMYASARTILLHTESGLAKALPKIANVRAVYRDRLAVVFVKQD